MNSEMFAQAVALTAGHLASGTHSPEYTEQVLIANYRILQSAKETLQKSTFDLHLTEKQKKSWKEAGSPT